MENKSMKLLRIKDLVQAVEVQAETIRYYERAGLMPTSKRSANNYRLYDQSDVNRLRFIRNCRALDMSLDEVRELINFIEHANKHPELAEDDCSGVRSIVCEHLGHVQNRLKSLKLLEKQLHKLLQACDHPEPTSSCGMVHSLFTEMELPKPGDIQGVHTT
ncbi:MAG: MerR family transcriptional regulator [Saezia sp.]